MKPFSPDVDLSVWIEAVRSELHRSVAKDAGLVMNQTDALRFAGLLGDIAAEARLLEARAKNAPPLDPQANVLRFIPIRRLTPARPSTGGDAA
jgi:hypothetical protein